MSTNYKLKVMRKSDKKVIGQAYVNIIKNMLEVDDDCLPIRGEEFGVARIAEARNKFIAKLQEITQKKERLQEGIFKCKSVEVKRDIEEDISYCEKDIEDYTYAISASYELQGYVSCLAEDMLIKDPQKVGGEDEEGGYTMAYSYWADTDSVTKQKVYSWAEDAILSIEC